MPNHTHKSAAVPFVNQKGERSMKRVKVERYVAGKRPAYAKDEDEDDEYYITDDEDNQSDVDEEFDEDQDDDEEEEDQEHQSSGDDEENESKADNKKLNKVAIDRKNAKGIIRINIPDKSSLVNKSSSDEEDDDDPRFRRLRQVEKVKHEPSTSRSIPKIESRVVMVDDYDEEDENEIRKRHNLARSKPLEEPLGPQTVLGGATSIDSHTDTGLLDNENESSRRMKPGQEAEDVLNSITFSDFRSKNKKISADHDADKKLKEMLDEEKQKAVIKAQLEKKIEEDIRMENEKQSLIKQGVATVDLEEVRTDDEDEDVAYEEWKLREIKRVVRDRSERAIETKAR